MGGVLALSLRGATEGSEDCVSL